MKNLSIQNFNELRAFAPGFIQLEENGPFIPCAFGIAGDSVVIYNDLNPDQENDSSYIYYIKKKINIFDLQVVVNNNITKNNQLDMFNRLSLIHKDINTVEHIFYFKKDWKYVKQFVKALKKFKIKITKYKLDMSKMY